LIDLKKKGVEILRVPIGDWTFDPYGPYIGCTDGAYDKLVWLLTMADIFGLKIWFDMHALEGSQNAFDNSGYANETIWIDEDHYDHWSNCSCQWLGDWDIPSQSYTRYDDAKLKKSVDRVE